MDLSVIREFRAIRFITKLPLPRTIKPYILATLIGKSTLHAMKHSLDEIYSNEAVYLIPESMEKKLIKRNEFGPYVRGLGFWGPAIVRGYAAAPRIATYENIARLDQSHDFEGYDKTSYYDNKASLIRAVLFGDGVLLSRGAIAQSLDGPYGPMGLGIFDITDEYIFYKDKKVPCQILDTDKVVAIYIIES